jgi:hypothetical protein
MAAMGMLLLGLVIGIGVGFFLGRRQATVAPTPELAAPPRIAAAPPSITPPPVPTKKARRLGLSEGDFVPADDILTRMQDAWEQGEELDPDAVAAEPPPAAAPAPPPRLGDDELTRRVLARLEGQAPAGEGPATGADADADAEANASADAMGEVHAEVAEAPGTVTEAVALLASDGYGDDLHLDGGQLACTSCGTSHAPDTIEVDRVFRFEGPSDPADEAIVLALRCPACGTKGSLVSAFGPDADPDLAEAFVYLASRARHR